MKLSLLLLCFITIGVPAQQIPENPNFTDDEGRRQGPWTILFNQDWQVTREKDSASYYRLIAYENDKPTGLVRDFYRDGTLQFQARLIADRPQEVYDGEVIWYHSSGGKESSARYDNGKLIEQVYFNLDGTIASESWVTINEQGLVADGEGRYEQARELFEKAFRQAKREFPPEHPNYSTALSNLGVSYFYSGLYDEAISLFEEIIGVNAKVFGKASRRYAASLTNLAGVYYTLARYNDALPLYEEALGIHEKLSGRDADYAYTLMELASVYRETGEYQKAESALLGSLEITAQTIGKENANYPAILTATGALYEILGEFSKAEALYTEALTLIEKIRGKDHPEYSRVLNNLAVIYDYLGNYEKAIQFYLESMAILEATSGKEHPEYANRLNNLGAVYYALKDTAKALGLYQQSIAIIEKVLGREHPSYPVRLINLGGVYSEMEQYDKAEQLFAEALQIREKILGKEHPDLSVSLHALGRLYIDVKKFEKAEPLLVESLRIREKLLGRQHPDYGLSLRELALLYIGWKDYPKAEKYFALSNQQLLEQIRSHFTALSDKEKSVFYAERIAPQFEFYNTFVLLRLAENPSITGALYNNQLATKALLFHTSNKIRQRILNGGDTELKALYARWIASRAELAKSYQMTEAERIQSGVDVDSLEEHLNDIEKRLSARSELFANANDRTIYTWQDVQKTLKADEAAIEIIRFREYRGQWTDTIRYAALIVTSKSDAPEYVLLKNGNDLETRSFNYYRNSVRGRLDDPFSYDRYWKPIAGVLERSGKIRRVYFSADGIYNAINLRTLKDPGRKRFLADEISIRLVTNTKDLLLPRRELKRTRASLFGFPQYGSGAGVPADVDRAFDGAPAGRDIKRFFDGGTITMLPGTQTEVNAVASLLKESNIDTRTYVGPSATEERVREISNPAVFHIATHGFFMGDAGSRGERSFAGFDVRKMSENPLLRSGLLLAGAQSTLDGARSTTAHDGILTAYEAMSLNLDSTDLVVLSACETGLGEIRNGEGVYGLQRAFQTAGARSVLMSLWKVDDAATQELMTGFYRKWLSTGRKAKAFEAAQLELRKKYPHPYYWGAFVLVGE